MNQCFFCVPHAHEGATWSRSRRTFFASDQRDVTDWMRSPRKLRVDEVSKRSSRCFSVFSLLHLDTGAPERDGRTPPAWTIFLALHVKARSPETFTDVDGVMMLQEDGSVSRSITINLDFSCCLRDFFSASATRHRRSVARPSRFSLTRSASSLLALSSFFFYLPISPCLFVPLLSCSLVLCLFLLSCSRFTYLHEYV